MRGEETQVAGVLADKPNFSGSICLPGTHSKWVQMDKGCVNSFKTFMTGELLDLLSNQSILRLSVLQGRQHTRAFDEAAYSAASDPSYAVSSLFSIRAESLLSVVDPEISASRLSGLIIGQEIGLAREGWVDNPVVLVGPDNVTELYMRVLEQFGADVTVMDATEVTVQGLQLVLNQAQTA